MDESAATPDPADELYELIRAFRLHLTRQARAGVYAVSAAPTTKPDDWSSYQFEDHAAEQGEAALPVQREAPPTGSGPVPAGELMSKADLPPGGFSAALEQALDEPARPVPRQAANPGPPAAGSRGVARTGPPSLADVRAELGDCRRCKLAAGRNHIVFGDGDPHASLMFIGEAPGADEDRTGLPFVGRAGQLLGRMIEAMGWTRDTVYIANVLKCRPPGNRDPERDEIDACKPFLAKQIAAIAPRIIVTLGRPAAHLLLNTDAPMHALRGTFHSYQGIRVMPTFHPAYLLRNPEAKGQAWSDLKQVIAELERLHIASPRRPKT